MSGVIYKGAERAIYRVIDRADPLYGKEMVGTSAHVVHDDGTGEHIIEFQTDVSVDPSWVSRGKCFKVGPAPEVRARGVFPRFDRVAKVSVDCDLGIVVVQAAADQMAKQFKDTPRRIIAPQAVADTAAEICDRLGLGLTLLPTEIMPCDAWAAVGESSMIWSPGA